MLQHLQKEITIAREVVKWWNQQHLKFFVWHHFTRHSYKIRQNTRNLFKIFPAAATKSNKTIVLQQKHFCFSFNLDFASFMQTKTILLPIIINIMHAVFVVRSCAMSQLPTSEGNVQHEAKAGKQTNKAAIQQQDRIMYNHWQKLNKASLRSKVI